jgi:hypothetical protein
VRSAVQGQGVVASVRRPDATTAGAGSSEQRGGEKERERGGQVGAAASKEEMEWRLVDREHARQG